MRRAVAQWLMDLSQRAETATSFDQLFEGESDDGGDQDGDCD